jgi:Glutathione synthase/Ribosomal protein S6 modification enzyme (glutaminyl transferase)
MEYVGILVNQKLHRGIGKGRFGHEQLPFYEEAGTQYRLTPCYFRLQDILPGGTMVRAFVKNGLGYAQKVLPMPRVIHNRAIYRKPSAHAKINALIGRGTMIFNACNRYGKLDIYNALMENVALRPHLPCTVEANPQSLKVMMEQYPSLMIKPNSGSIGRGIMKLERKQDAWFLTYPSLKKRNCLRTIVFTDHLPLLLRQRMRKRRYIVQQMLPLATWDGRPFDFRVSVQKNETGAWQVTGMVGKVAAKGKYVTNVAQGGQVLDQELLLSGLPVPAAQVKQQIAEFALKAAEQLSLKFPHLADLGLDIGITEFGFPVFIESNGRDQRYSFAKGGMTQEWKACYRNPVGYARHLLEHPEHY